MDISLGMITAPRSVSLVDRSIRSLRHGGFLGELRVYAEPGSVVGETSGVRVLPGAGCGDMLSNYRRALSDLLSTGSSWLGLMEDDIELRSGAYSSLNGLLGGLNGVHVGYVSLYTPREYSWQVRGSGWRVVGGGRGFGSLFYVWGRAAAEDFVGSCAGVGSNTDVVVTGFLRSRGYLMYYDRPSWVEHTGVKSSTCGHSHSGNVGLDFVGDFVG